MKKAVKYGAIIIAVAAVSGGIAVAVTQPPAVECIELEITMLENTFNEMGEIIPLSETDIYTKSGGRLLAFSLSEGAAVQEGDKLFTFDGSDLQSEAESMAGEISVVDSQIKNTIVSLEMQKNSLESDKEALRIQAEKAQMEEKKLGKDLQTVQLLHDFGDIPAQDLDNTRFAYELAVKNRELAAASLNYVDVQILALSTQINDLRQGLNLGTEKAENQRQQLLAQKAALEARLNLLYEKQSETEIFSPQEGIVRDITVKAGQILTPGTRLCSVYRLHQYRVECYILVENIAGILVGDEVEVTLQLRDEDKIFTGSIVQLAHDAADIVSKVGLSEKRLKVEIAVDEAGWEDVGPYWPVEIRFITAQAKNCLIVPKTALFEDSDRIWKVWVVREGKAVAVPVEKGLQTPSQVEIKGALSPGDIIVRNIKTSDVFEGKSIKAVL